MSLLNIIKPYPSPLITGRGIDLDFPMLAGCLALLGLGLVMIASASTEVAAVQSGSALYYMMTDKGTTDRTVKALTRRIGLSVGLILLVLLAIWMGWIKPHGVYG